MAKKRNIGGIFVSLFLNDKEFAAGMKRAQVQLAKFDAFAGKAFVNVGKAAAVAFAAVGTAAGGAMVAGIAKGIKDINELDDAAKRLRVTFAEAASLNIGAILSGTNLEAVGGAVARLTKSLADAASGRGQPVADALKKLGLNAEALMRLPVEKQLGKIFDGLNALPNANERAATAMELFGRSAANMNDLISKGSKGLEENRRKAELYGVALNSIEVKAVTDLGDAIDEMQVAWNGLFQQLAVKVSPTLISVTDKMRGVVEEMGGMERVADRAFVLMANGAYHVGQAIDLLRVGWYGLATAANVVSTAFWGAMDAMSSAGYGLSKYLTAGAIAITEGKDAARKFTAAFDAQMRDEGPRFTEMAFAKVKENLSATTDSVAAAWKDLMDEKNGTGGKIKTFVDDTRTNHRAKNFADSLAKILGLTDKNKNAFYGLGEISESALKKTEKAAKAANDQMRALTASTLSLQTVMSKGGNSANARNARRAQQYYDRAEEAEAKGQWQRAERLRAQGERYESRVRLRDLREGKAGVPLNDREKWQRENERMREEADKLEARGGFRDIDAAARLRVKVEEREKGVKEYLEKRREAVRAELIPVKPVKNQEPFYQKIDELISTLIGLPRQLGII